MLCYRDIQREHLRSGLEQLQNMGTALGAAWGGKAGARAYEIAQRRYLKQLGIDD